jgi:hypothetical protein
MRLYSFFTLAAAGLFSTPALFGATTDVTLSGVINGGNLSISKGGDFAFETQTIGSDGTQASVSDGAKKSVTIDIDDARGTSSPISVTMTYDKLSLPSGHPRPVDIETSGGSGGFTANHTDSNGVSADITTAVQIASAVADYNRHGSFTLSVTPLGLTGTNARKGTYTGTITLTVQ